MAEFDVRPSDLDDEVMTSGGLPRWMTAIAALVAVALAVVLVGQHLRGGHHHAAAPSPSVTHAIPAPVPPNVAFDLAHAPGGTWLLETHTLAQVSGTRVIRSVALRGVAIPPRSVPVLAYDAATRKVWVVLTNAAPARMIEFDAATLKRVRDVTWAQLVQSAAAFHNYLYLSTSFGVAGLPPRAVRPHLIGGLAGAIGPLVLDAARNRVVTIDLGYPTDIWSYRYGQLPVEARMPVILRHGTLGVVGKSLWLAGYGDHGAVLMRLNPSSLMPTLRAPARSFGPGAVIAGTGKHVLWVRSDDGSNLLACVSASTGRVEQTWRVHNVNAVSSDRRGALVATPTGVLGLVLSGCAG